VPAAVLTLTDLLLMPISSPVVMLEDMWLAGEAAAVVTCLVPGLLLGRWTVRDGRLAARALV
jgi:hypothetical protein